MPPDSENTSLIKVRPENRIASAKEYSNYPLKMYIIEQAQVKGGRSYGKISTEPRRDTDRQRDDVPLSQTGLDEKPFQGNIYITDQRACFKISMMPGALDMDLPLEDIRGFSVSGVAIFTQVKIHGRTGENYSFTGFPAKKL